MVDLLINSLSGGQVESCLLSPNIGGEFLVVKIDELLVDTVYPELPRTFNFAIGYHLFATIGSREKNERYKQYYISHKYITYCCFPIQALL